MSAGSRTGENRPDAATWLNLNRPHSVDLLFPRGKSSATRSYIDALEERFLDEAAACVRAEEALRMLWDHYLLVITDEQKRQVLDVLAAVPEENQ